MSADIPWTVAQKFGEEYGKTQVVIWAWAAGTGQHVVTWGGPELRDSLAAAEAGNYVKRAAGWEEKSCRALPESISALLAEVDRDVADDVRRGVLHKGTALAVLYHLREAVRRRDQGLAEKLNPTRTEKAEVPSGQFKKESEAER